MLSALQKCCRNLNKYISWENRFKVPRVSFLFVLTLKAYPGS